MSNHSWFTEAISGVTVVVECK